MCNRRSLGVSGFMPYQRIISLVDELYRLGMREVYFHGVGEPLMHPRITDILNYAGSKYPSLKMGIVSNGTLLDRGIVQSVIRNRVKVRVSLHAADRRTWQEIHPHDRTGLFDRTIEGIRSITEADPGLIELLFVIFRSNSSRIREMAELAGSLGVREVLFRPMRFLADRAGKNMNSHLMLDAREFNAAGEMLKDLKRRYRGAINLNIVPFESSEYDEIAGRPSSRKALEGNSCHIGFVLSVILTSGEVIGCLEESFDRPMGNILSESFRQIWWSSGYQEFRRRQRHPDRGPNRENGCHTYCQHLAINRKMNGLLSLKPSSIREIFSRK